MIALGRQPLSFWMMKSTLGQSLCGMPAAAIQSVLVPVTWIGTAVGRGVATIATHGLTGWASVGTGVGVGVTITATTSAAVTASCGGAVA